MFQTNSFTLSSLFIYIRRPEKNPRSAHSTAYLKPKGFSASKCDVRNYIFLFFIFFYIYIFFCILFLYILFFHILFFSFFIFHLISFYFFTFILFINILVFISRLSRNWHDVNEIYGFVNILSQWRRRGRRRRKKFQSLEVRAQAHCT